jgi:hypothetical protein
MVRAILSVKIFSPSLISTNHVCPTLKVIGFELIA